MTGDNTGDTPGRRPLECALRLTYEPLHPEEVSQVDSSIGAVAGFDGIVRGLEGGAPIAALVYEAYEEMAIRMLRKIADEVHARHPCSKLDLTHRLGEVKVGEIAIRVRVYAPHRAEAFAFLAQLMDRLKQDVPIWKSETVFPSDHAQR